MNVDINLSTLDDNAYTARVTEEAKELGRDAEADADAARRALR
jgi:formiminotetrahydrofolate cyclodeaminase